MVMSQLNTSIVSRISIIKVVVTTFSEPIRHGRLLVYHGAIAVQLFS